MSNVRLSELEFLQSEGVENNDLVYIARELNDQFKQRIHSFRSSKKYRIVDSDDDILSSDEVLLVYGETNEVEQLTLPDPSDVNSRLFLVKNLQTRELNITVGSPTDVTIEFVSSLIIPRMGSVIIYCDGSNYFVIAADQNIDISNVLIVDAEAVSGSGERGFLNHRFSSINDAVDAAINGDLILVLSGVYKLKNMINHNIAIPGLNIHFMPGSVVYFGYTPFNSTSSEWVNAGGGSDEFRCTGYAKFIAYSDGVFKRLITATGNGPVNMFIEIDSLDTDSQLVASDTGPLDDDGDPVSPYNEGPAIFQQDTESGNANKVIVKVHNDMILRKSVVRFYSREGGNLRLSVGGDIRTMEESTAFDIRNNNFYLQCRNIISAATDAAIKTGSELGGAIPFSNIIEVENQILCSVGSAFDFGHLADYVVKAKTIRATSAEAILMTSDTTVRIDGARIVSESVNHNAIQRNTNTGSLMLRSCSITSAGDHAIASTAASSVTLESQTLANKPNNSNITTVGFNTTVDGVYQGSMKIRDDFTINSLEDNNNQIITVDNNGKLQVSGSTIADIDPSLSIVPVNDTYTINELDTVYSLQSTLSYPVSLPAATAANEGQRIFLYKEGNSALGQKITVNTDGVQVVKVNRTEYTQLFLRFQGESIVLISHTDHWDVVGESVLFDTNVSASDEDQFINSIQKLNDLGVGGVVNLTTEILITADRTVNLTGIRIFADSGTPTQIKFTAATHRLIVTGTGFYFDSVRFTGVRDERQTGVSQYFMEIISTDTNAGKFENCIFRDIVTRDPNMADGNIKITNSGGNGWNITFTDCDVFTDGDGGLADGLHFVSGSANTSFLNLFFFLHKRLDNNFNLFRVTGYPILGSNCNCYTDGGVIFDETAGPTPDPGDPVEGDIIDNKRVLAQSPLIAYQEEKSVINNADDLLIHDKTSGELRRISFSNLTSDLATTSDLYNLDLDLQSQIDSKQDKIPFVAGTVTTTTDFDPIPHSTDRATIKYLLQLDDDTGTNLRSSEIMATYIGSSVIWQEYAINELGTPITDAAWSVEATGGNIVMKLTVTSGTYNLRIMRTRII